MNPGLCECGCGRKTRIAPRTSRTIGWVKGEPIRFIRGHNKRRRGPDYAEKDRGWDTPCWEWLHAASNGYGHVFVPEKGQPMGAHRWMYEKANGRIPEGLHLDHLCENPICCNPDHLEPVTHTENMRRGLVAKVTEDAVRLIRATSKSAKELAIEYGITTTQVHAIRKYESWKEVV